MSEAQASYAVNQQALADMTPATDPAMPNVTRTVAKLTREFEEYAVDGFDLMEVLRFMFSAGLQLIILLSSVTSMTGMQRRNFVVRTLRQIYAKRNPDIPWIFEPFESWFENLLIDQIIPALCDGVIEALKKLGLIKLIQGQTTQAA